MSATVFDRCLQPSLNISSILKASLHSCAWPSWLGFQPLGVRPSWRFLRRSRRFSTESFRSFRATLPVVADVEIRLLALIFGPRDLGGPHEQDGFDSRTAHYVDEVLDGGFGVQENVENGQ